MGRLRAPRGRHRHQHPVHYADLEQDLDGEMRRLADHLGIAVDPARWSALVDAARFESMAPRAADLVPDGLGIIRDPAAFFRSGRSGDGTRLLTDDQRDRYHRRLATLAPPDIATWLDR